MLFQFIETQLPQKIRIIKIHHSANRIPNFAELGKESLPEDYFDDVSSTASFSTIQHKKSNSFLSTSSMRIKKLSTGTTYSNLSASSSSICSGNENIIPLSQNFCALSNYSHSEFQNCNIYKHNNDVDYENSNSKKQSFFNAIFNNQNNFKNQSYNSLTSSTSRPLGVSRRSTINSRFSFTSATSSSISSTSCEANLSQISNNETSNVYNDLQTRKHSLDCEKQYKELMKESLLDGKMRPHSQSCHHFKNFNSSGQSFVINQNDFETTSIITKPTLISVAERLNAHQLTIFAISEEKRMCRSQRLRKRTYCGVDVFYTQESIESQEVFGKQFFLYILFVIYKSTCI